MVQQKEQESEGDVNQEHTRGPETSCNHATNWKHLNETGFYKCCQKYTEFKTESTTLANQYLSIKDCLTDSVNEVTVHHCLLLFQNDLVYVPKWHLQVTPEAVLRMLNQPPPQYHHQITLDNNLSLIHYTMDVYKCHP